MAVKRIAFDTIEVNAMLEALEAYLQQLELLGYSSLNSNVIANTSVAHQLASDLYSKLSRYQRKMESEDRIHAARD